MVSKDGTRRRKTILNTIETPKKEQGANYSIAESLDKLDSHREELNQITDTLNKIVVNVENHLANTCKIKDPCSVDVTDDDVFDNASKLRYSLTGGRRRITVTLGSGNKVIVKPWAECSRDVRLRTIHYLPKLVERVVHKVEVELNEARESLEFINNNLDIR